MEKRTYQPKICECGCGEEFTPTREWQRFKDPGHRWNHWYHARKTARTTQEKFRKAATILERTDLTSEERLTKISRILGPRRRRTKSTTIA